MVTAESASTALALIEQGNIDVVLTDIVMAGEMDGATLAKKVREKHPAMPLVLVTGYANRPETASDEFPLLRKPYRLAELSRAIAKAGVEVQRLRDSNIVPLSRGRDRGRKK